MTTAAEIRQLAAAGGAEAQRVIFMPATTIEGEQGLRSLAREIAALANRDGGRVVLGASAQGRFEGELPIAHDDAVAALQRVLSTLITPPVAGAIEHLADEDGEAIVVRLMPRHGAPHRAPSPAGSGEPAAYVRIGDRTRGATDEQLQWMERVHGDPAIERSWSLSIPTLGLHPAGSDDPPIARIYDEMLGRVPAALAQSLASDRGVVATAYAELAPWALLIDLDREFSEDGGSVSLDDLALPGRRSVLAEVPGGIAALLGDAARPGMLARLLRRTGSGPRFALPANVEPHVDLLAHQRKGRIMLAHDAWVVTFAATPAGTSEDPAGTVELTIDLAVSLAFPQREGQVEPQADALRIERLVRDHWGGADS